METVCNPQFKLKVAKITLFAFNLQIKKRFKNTTKTEFSIDILEYNYMTCCRCCD